MREIENEFCERPLECNPVIKTWKASLKKFHKGSLKESKEAFWEKLMLKPGRISLEKKYREESLKKMLVIFENSSEKNL